MPPLMLNMTKAPVQDNGEKRHVSIPEGQKHKEKCAFEGSNLERIDRFNDEVGLAAVGHVDDQDALVRFMIVDKPTGAVGKAVFKRIKLDQVSDRERLTAVAHCAPTADDRSKVLAMLDYEELMDVYLRADDTRLAHEALNKVDDPNVLPWWKR